MSIRLTYPTGDVKPDIRNLNKHIIEELAVHWERLGLELGLKDYQIANISKDNEELSLNRLVACFRAMLELWLIKIPNPTWGKLDDAIKTTTLKMATSPTSTNKGGNHGYFYNVNNNIIVDKTFMNVHTYVRSYIQK